MRDYKPTEQPIIRAKSNNIVNNNNFQSNNYPSNNYQSNNYPSNNNLQNNDRNEKINLNNNDKKWDRFGGKAPFQHLNEKDDEVGGMENERYNKVKKEAPVENVVYKKPISTSADRKEKDPMVWDPPEDKKVKKAPAKNVVNPNPPSKNVKKVESKGGDNDKRRNYEKPWKLPEEKKSNNAQNLKENKSSFLLHCYPDGTGPDSDLIEMLEKEVVDTNPNVKFEDIADLDKAKNVLKEAVLLPLLMPDYFKVNFIIFNKFFFRE
jgi:katanin p60 ATPase-containing subunit A1